jgi:integrase
LQTTVQAGLLAVNPVRTVRAPRAPLKQEVRPLAPTSVEALRAVLGVRDATLVSLCSRTRGSAPEKPALRWGNVKERTLVIGASKTGTRRTVRLLDALAANLRAWRLASGRPDDDAAVIPRPSDGNAMSAKSFNVWRSDVSVPALRPRAYRGRGRTTCATASRRCCSTRGGA